MSTTQTDVRTNATENSAESIRPFPRCGERTDCSAAGSPDGPVVAIPGENDRSAIAGLPGLYVGEQFIKQEAGIVVAQAIILEAAIEPIECLIMGCLHSAMHHKDTNGDGHLFAVDELVEDSRRVVLHAILIHVNAGWCFAIVLSGDIDPIVPHGTGEDLAAGEGVPGHFALGDRFLGMKIRSDANQE